MLRAISDGEGVLQFKNDMPGVTEADLTSDRDKIKTSVKERIEASGDLRYDLIFQGGETHAWVTEVSSVAQDGNFDAFVERMLGNALSFEEMTVCYGSDGNLYEAEYDRCFRYNGEIVDTDYARFENDYVPEKVERKSEIIEFAFNGHSLVLNFEEGTRVQS